ncbi:MAG TPA: ferredoxin [bacterium]|nr:ferredoxin [bacterium]
MSKKPIIDPDLCTGCTLCTNGGDSQVFKMNDDESAAVVAPMPNYDEHTDEINDAIDNCPSGAIAWKSDEA